MRIRLARSACVAIAMTVATHPALASSAASPAPRISTAPADSASAIRAVVAFRSALSSGDSTAALAMLSHDVIVLESGDVERYDDYRSHHLAADIAFAKAITATHAIVSARVDGNTAWVSSTSSSQGQFNGRPVDSAGAELIVLTRKSSKAAWMIRAIHWSSHRRQS